MNELGIHPFLVLSAFLFACGVVCIATKRNAIGVLMGVELVLNAANVNLVAFARFNTAFRLDGQVFAL
ncbi:MAG: NADH-quinone oxidoreductase subunit K, partial [Gemmataceae bacterium]